jgi:hypothetical protein
MENNYEEINKDILYKLFITERKSLNEIVIIFNCSKSLISKKIKEYGLSYKMRVGSNSKYKIDEEILYEKYITKKMSVDMIANEIGCSNGCITYYLNKFDITFESQLSSFQLSSLQYDLLIGSCLGDGSLSNSFEGRGNYRFMTGHAENQKEFAEEKLKLLENVCFQNTLSKRDNIIKNDGRQNFYYFYTMSLPVFNDFVNMSIKDLLDNLNANSFAIWMMDDCNIEGRNNNFYNLAAGRFDKDEIEYTQKILKDKFDLDSIIHNKKSAKNGHMGVRFNVEESKKIIKIIEKSDFSNIIKETMSYKLIL